MHRRVSLVIFLLIFSLTGCGAFRYMDNSSPEEIKKFNSSKDELWSQVKTLESDKANGEKMVTEQQAQITQVNRIVSNQQGQIDQMIVMVMDKQKEIDKKNATLNELNQEISAMKIQLQQVRKTGQKDTTPRQQKLDRMKTESARLTKEVAGLKGEIRRTASERTALERKSIKIKILSNDDNLSSANNMAKKLIQWGYVVNRVDKAPRGNFEATTIFYAPQYRSAADQLAKQIGGHSVVKPLTWKSAFHLILVTTN